MKTYSLLCYVSLKYSILLSLFNSVKKDVIHFINFAVIIKNVRGGVKKRLSHIYLIVSYDRMKHLKLLRILCKDFLSLIGISQGFREKKLSQSYIPQYHFYLITYTDTADAINTQPVSEDYLGSAGIWDHQRAVRPGTITKYATKFVNDQMKKTRLLRFFLSEESFVLERCPKSQSAGLPM